MKKQNFTKEDFLRFWGANGYVETWDGYKHNWSKEIQNLILNQIGYDKDKTVLEIGCGGGYWTKFLCENSSKVYAIDLLPKSPLNNNNLTYIENEDMQFDCNSIPSNSIDFAFSFGTFCHLSTSACELYLKDTLRVLKKGGTAIFMYSDDASLKKFYNDESVVASQIFGEFNDYSNILPMVQKYDVDCKRILEYRDLLVLITKK
jgi:cyclopropane fatty-acyl-phospholipid synthase-like methyltransferase